MPKRYFKIDLTGDAEIHVFFETANGIIISFVVKLVFRVNDRYYEVVRFDSGITALIKISWINREK